MFALSVLPPRGRIVAVDAFVCNGHTPAELRTTLADPRVSVLEGTIAQNWKQLTAAPGDVALESVRAAQSTSLTSFAEPGFSRLLGQMSESPAAVRLGSVLRCAKIDGAWHTSRYARRYESTTIIPCAGSSVGPCWSNQGANVMTLNRSSGRLRTGAGKSESVMIGTPQK
jgi:hypothetical protein